MAKGTLKNLRLLGVIFIWLGFAIGILSLLLSIPSVCSFTGLLMLLASTIETVARTAGLGALLLALTGLIDTISSGEDAHHR